MPKKNATPRKLSQAAEDTLRRIVSYAFSTPLDRVLYWGGKLGLFDPNDQFEAHHRVGLYLVAEHGYSAYEAGELDLYQIADILEADYKKRHAADVPNPSTPMSKREAAKCIGTTRKKLSAMMDNKSVRFRQLTRQTFVFSRDDLPKLPAD